MRPVLVLDRADHDRWLSRDALVDELLRLLRPCPDGLLTAHPVGPQVNDPRHEGPSCAAPLERGGGPATEAQGRLF